MADETEPGLAGTGAEPPPAQPAVLLSDTASPNGDDPMAAIARLTRVIEKMQRATSSPDSGNAQSADIIQRIERLESWVASNRLT